MQHNPHIHVEPNKYFKYIDTPFHYVTSKQFLRISVVNIVILLISVTRDIYFTFVRPGRGIPHTWFFLCFYNFSLVMFHLVEPYETICDL